MTQGGLTGGCQCGAVRYRLGAAPYWAGICHCRMCQKAGGSPYMAFASVKSEDFETTRGKLRLFASSAIAERGFCAECGTPLTYRPTGGASVSVTLGSLDRPDAVSPTEQLGVESRLPWCENLDELPGVNTLAWLKKKSISDVGNRQHPDHET